MLQQLYGRSPTPALLKLYHIYRDVESLADYERTKGVLKVELNRYKKSFIVIDALDEYRIGDPSAPHHLAQFSSLYNTEVLVMFYNTEVLVMYHQRPLKRCACFRDRQYTESHIWKVLNQRGGLAKEVTGKVVKRADGVFLSSKLTVQSMLTCRRIVDVNNLLDRPPSDLYDWCKEIVEQIRETAPWVLRSIYS